MSECKHDWKSMWWTDNHTMLVGDGMLNCDKCGEKKENRVFWSEPSDPDDWSLPSPPEAKP